MVIDILDSIMRPSAYARFASESAGRTVRFIALLSLIYIGALGATLKLRVAPMFAETFAWLQTQMPAIQLANGTATSSATSPLRLEHPRFKEVAAMIDTARTAPVTLRQMAEARVKIYLTAHVLYVEGGQNKIEEIDFSGSKSSRPITFDASAYKDLERGFNWIFYPAVLLIAYLVFAVALAFCASVYALVGLMLASLMGSSLEFAALCRIGTHAQTAGCLLYAMDMLLPWALPGRIYASITISLTLLWLGTRAAVRAAANPTAPA